MDRHSVQRSRNRRRVTALLAMSLGLLALAAANACVVAPTPTPTAPPIRTTPTVPSPGEPTATPTTAPTAIPRTPRPGPAEATPTRRPTATPTLEPLFLKVLSPQEGALVETPAVRVVGLTAPDAVVAVNGEVVEVRADGSFSHDVVLEDDVALIEVVATDFSGETAYESVAVLSVPPTVGLPFSVFYPVDDTIVSDPVLWVVGGTEPEAVVAVNGTPVEVNALGLFSKEVLLEEETNLIEVVATDAAGSVRFQTAAVFYRP